MTARASGGRGFSTTNLTKIISEIQRDSPRDRLTHGELNRLYEAVRRDWVSSGRKPLTEWLSARSLDVTETVMVSVADWSKRRLHRVSTTGSRMVVVARYWAETYEDARKVHYALNGWWPSPQRLRRRKKGRTCTPQ